MFFLSLGKGDLALVFCEEQIRDLELAVQLQYRRQMRLYPVRCLVRYSVGCNRFAIRRNFSDTGSTSNSVYCKETI